MNDILSNLCIEKIKSKLIASRELANQLADAGLSLPEYDFNFIEGLRTRMPEEQHVSVYFDEIFKEALNLKRGIWNPLLHQELPAGQQSPYVNALLRQAVVDGRPVGAGRSLDANYLLYQRMSVDEPDRWLAYLQLIKAIKNKELENFKACAPDIFLPNDKVTVKAVAQLIESICSKLGLAADVWSDRKSVVVVRKIDDNCFISACWDDLLSLKKRGGFQFICRVHDAPVDFDSPVTESWLFSINSLAPGGYFYGSNNGSWEAVALSAYANLAFFKLMIPQH